MAKILELHRNKVEADADEAQISVYWNPEHDERVITLSVEAPVGDATYCAAPGESIGIGAVLDVAQAEELCGLLVTAIAQCKKK